MVGKWLAHSNTSESSDSYHALRLDKKWNITATSGVKAAHSSLSSLDKIQNLCGHVGDDVFPTIQPLSLSVLYCNFHGICSDKLHSLVPPVQNFIF